MGGGTDLPEFYLEEEGAVISTSLDKAMYITINDRFDTTFRLSYSKTEIKDSIDSIDHPIFKLVLKKYMTPDRGLELISMADIPSGTGLGSSSSFTVGLLHAMRAHLGQFCSAEELAEEASHIEINQLKEPIGKQDQYAAAFGGLRIYRFLPSGKVSVEPVTLPSSLLHQLESSCMMFYTGKTRSAASVLTEQRQNVTQKRVGLREMRELVFRMRDLLYTRGKLSEFGALLNEGWQIKKSMASQVSNPQIDEWYERGCSAGALGGKILGAGGGGFLMLFCPPENQDRVRSELRELRSIPLKFSEFGSQIVFVNK